MTESEQHRKRQSLGDRSTAFARRVRAWATQVPRTIATIEDVKQLIRSSGSVGANCIEANEALSKKDQGMRLKIRRKEAKESAYWLELLDISLPLLLERERVALREEATELKCIFHAIVQKYYG